MQTNLTPPSSTNGARRSAAPQGKISVIGLPNRRRDASIAHDGGGAVRLAWLVVATCSIWGCRGEMLVTETDSGRDGNAPSRDGAAAADAGLPMGDAAAAQDAARVDDAATEADGHLPSRDGGETTMDGAAPDGSTDGGSNMDGGVIIDGGRPRRDGGGSGDGGGRSDGGHDGGMPAADAGPSDPLACIAPTALPPYASPAPPAGACDYMDWGLSPDGHYLISQFGTSADSTTWGRGTSCRGLGTHYWNWCCQYDRHSDSCIDGGTKDFLGCPRSDPRLPTIPWVQGHVDYNYNTVVNSVRGYFFESDGSLKPTATTMDFDHPEYFYVAGAQRFDCGSTLRMTNTENGRCVVVYVEDGGPGSYYEQAGRGGRRIIDSSPAVITYLAPAHVGWGSSSLMRVEWGRPGDRPGTPCEPCGPEGRLASSSNRFRGTNFDLNHFEALNCRAGAPFP